MTYRKWLLLVSLVGLLTFTGIISAQDSETYEGELEDGDEDEYELDLEEGDAVLITLEGSGGLDTYLILENEDGDIVAENDDINFPENTDSQIGYVAEEDGEYTVIVTNFPGTDGDYELTIEYVDEDDLEDMAGSDSSDFDASDLGEPDDVFEGEIEDGDEDEYEIELEEGQALVAIAIGLNDLDTYLILENEDGDTVAENDDIDFPAITDSQIVYIADEAGEFTLIMTNYPGSEGDYELSIYILDGDEATAYAEESGIRIDIDTTPERDPDESYEGTLEDDEDTDEYVLSLEEGDGIIAALYETDGDMDTFISVLDPNGVEIVANDDRGDYSTLNSQVAFIATEDGDYTVVVDNYPGAPGDYLLEIYFASDEEVALAEQALRIVLSGPVETYDTENFRIHYTLEGFDAVAGIDYIEEVAEIVEDVYDIQINDLGWNRPPTDGVQGGDDRYDVYLINLDGLYGYVSSSSGYADNPFTDEVEEFATAGYLVLDNDYDGFDDPARALLATAAHEFHHVVQYGYDNSDLNWYYESTASWMETVTFPDDEEATIYVQDVYSYPEICFGADGDADTTGFAIYGSWLFMEYATETIDEDFVVTLWDNIIVEDGWTPFEMTLEQFGISVEDALAGYHVNNLVRDYLFVTNFDDQTVWIEGEIDDEGEWEHNGDGVQELGANYFILDLDEDTYEFSFEDGDDDLELYVVGIDGDDGDVYALGDGGVVDLDGYDNAYLMVFNTDYDDSIDRCRSLEYTINVEESNDDALNPVAQVDASEFEEPEYND